MTKTTDRLAGVLATQANLSKLAQYLSSEAEDEAFGVVAFASSLLQSLSTDLDKAQSQLVDAEQRLAMVEGLLEEWLLGEWRDMHEDDPCHAHYLEDDCIVKRTRAALNPQPTGKEGRDVG